MKRLNVNQFYAKLNRYYSHIKHYNKDVIYDYNALFHLERDTKVTVNKGRYDEHDTYIVSTFNIAIFVRDTGTHMINFDTTKKHFCFDYHKDTFETLKQNNDFCLLCQKCTNNGYNEYYYITKVNLKTIKK